jgi:predicted metal-dependent phosphoesterase TrpH
VIDLHLHTTASDGRSTPDELVREVAAAGITTFAVTDHDTVAGLAAAARAARGAGLAWVPGIEMTAVHHGRDVHLLGYFIDAADADLGAFLRHQREHRRRRVLEIVDRLARLGRPIDVAPLESAARGSGRSLGRPLVAASLVAAGHAASISDAFDRYLAEGRPAFVERIGSPPADIIGRIRAAGGLASLAHPGKLQRDDLIPGMVDAGLAALEVFHPDHGQDDVAHYEALALAHELAVTGGSDYHGAGSGRVAGFGQVGLTPEAYDALARRASRHPSG